MDGDSYEDGGATVGLGEDGEIPNLSNFSVFPNPSSGRVRMALSPTMGDLAGAVLDIMDAAGRIVHSESLEGRRELSVDGLGQGVFWMRIRGRSGAILGLRKMTVVR